MSKPNRPHVAIVGGGVLGMTLGLRLRQRGHPVTVLEAAPEPGGLASSWNIGPHRWDRFYHVILLSDANTRGLLEQIGVDDRLRWRETRTGFYTDGQLYSMSDTLEFLRFPPLRMADKLRLGATIFYAARVEDWRRLEQIPVADWLRRLSGHRTFEKIWLPLLRAKLGENYRHASAAFIWATIARMYAARRTGLKKEMFGYVEGGFATILERLGAALAEAGATLRCGARVERVETDGDGVRVRLDGGDHLDAGAAVLTAPTPVVSRLCPALTEAEHERLSRVTYQGVVCASLLLTRPLGGYYVTNLTDDWVPFTGVIEMTALVDPAELGGHHLVYLPKYLVQSDDFWTRSDDSIRAELTGALQRIYPDLRDDEILAFKVARARHVQALPTLDYSRSVVPPTKTSMRHVYLVNGAQIVNGTLNVNETVGLANQKAVEIAGELRGCGT